MYRHRKATRSTVSREKAKRAASTQAVARRSNPKEWAKVAGRPWSVTTSLGASEGRALCVSRSSQERRQCARWARVKMSEVWEVTSGGVREGELSRQTVSLRTTFSQTRQIRQRGQSFHTTGARGSGTCASSPGGEEAEGAASSGHNTALTRRGLIVALLS